MRQRRAAGQTNIVSEEERGESKIDKSVLGKQKSLQIKASLQNFEIKLI